MNSQELISSGIIESYVLGTASAEEIRLVNEMASKFPEVEAEVRAVEEAILAFASASAPDLSRVKSRLFEEINKESSGREEAKIVSLPPKKDSPPFFKYAAAVLLVLFVSSAVINFVLNSKVKDAEEKMSFAQKDNAALLQQSAQQQELLEKTNAQLAVISNPDNKIVKLKGLELSPNAAAVIYWNSTNTEVYINAQNLPAADSDKQYQLWAIVNGKPVDAGVFDLTQDSLQKMKNITGAQAFAVTLEKKGGSAEPTLSAMYLLGNV